MAALRLDQTRLDQTRAGAAGVAISTPEAQAIPRPGRFAAASRSGPGRSMSVSRSSAFVQIDAASFRTGNGQRDDRVRSERLLDTERYPLITFRSENMDRGEGAMVQCPREHAHRPDRVRRDGIPRNGRTVPRHDH
jgi:polyisoprenoid-binding protein YceI